MAVTGLFAQTTATTPVQETRTSGVVGIAQGQTARFNVLNPAAAVPATTVTAACSAVLTYYDAAGTMLKSSTVTVAPGTAGHLDLFSDVDLALPLGQRRQIRVTMAVPLVPAAASGAIPAPVCGLIGTLEIFDEIGGRAEVLGGMHVVPAEGATPVSATAAGSVH